MQRISSPIFIGRAAQLASLDAAAASAGPGGLAAVLIGGEAGVGKTRLMTTWAARARATGWNVEFGSCLDLGEAGPPFVSIIEATRALLQSVEPGERTRILGDSEPAISALLPELRTGLDDDPSPTSLPSQGQLFAAWVSCLERAASVKPLAIVIEDLHLADESTRTFLAYLIGSIRGGQFLLIATYRTDDLHRRHPLRGFLSTQQRSARVESIVVEPFDRTEYAEFLASIMGRPVNRDLAENFFGRAEGNAFLTEELVAAGEGDPKAPVPASVRDAMLDRVGAVGPAAQRVLAVSAVAGTTVHANVIDAASELPEEALIEGTREAIAANLLVALASGERVRFRHALLREVVLDDLLPAERRHIHHAVATALERDRSLAEGGTEAAPAALAHHWSQGGEPTASMLASIEAGQAATAMTAFREALLQYERAIELWDTNADARGKTDLTNVDLIERASEAARLGGDYQRAIQHAETVVSLLNEREQPFRVADLLIRLSWMCSETAANERGKAYAAEAVRIAPTDPPSATRVRALGSLASFTGMGGDLVAFRRLLDEAVAAGDLIGDYWPRIELATDDLFSGRVEEAIESIRRVQQESAAAGDAESEVAALTILAYDLVASGYLAAGLEVAQEAIPKADLAGFQRADGAWARVAAAEALLRLGDPAAASALIDEALNALPEGKVDAALHMLAARIAEQRGDLTAARAHLQAAVPETLPQRERIRRAVLAQIQIRVLLADGKPHAALERATEAIDGLQTLAPLDGTNRRGLVRLAAICLTAAADCAEIDSLRGDAAAVDEARRAASAFVNSIDWLDGALAVAGIPQAPGLEPWRHWCEAETQRVEGRPDPDSWSRVAAAFDRHEEPFPAAEARYREAEALLGHKASRQAIRSVISKALTTAVAIEARPLVDKLELLARRAHVVLTPPATAQVTSASPSAVDLELARYRLTRRERQVLALLADGWTNRQIGEHLFITESTAGVHVANVVSKMGLQGRVAAGIAAQRLGVAGGSISDEAR